ncbi:isochorismate lyase [Pseudomonas chlororaphis]|uniref:isochorismate lyase n=1 Tax=Pseudomonas chlororaphis TaxID=587753 RepID=UPI000789E9BF|nr:isochorismate lyase [Pseudomonas chlororaphis]AMS18267.1 isochorismate-pyruvate lyase [Pseudomonas chlororaphis]ROL83384.1 isochorismate-pyruvate lyase [Pseudomonas chlororaphis]RON77584.1 isochorismate-pyruvate lyase [Pseudomonas chlororaphis]WDG52947.1 isochorismate lyase [Pseudomonas chlororaphis]WDH86031.1 isochorismate lyase [Pseudomonas chlororaphis]
MDVIQSRAPEQCAGMEDIRREIDRLDQAVIKLLGERFQYVLAASKFKTSETAVRAPERFRAMLLQRREWAQAEGLSADAIEKLYSDLVQHFIAEELKGWKSAQAQSPA